jgi:two-component system cell cycle sensor histidine kinase/response regulator CckA
VFIHRAMSQTGEPAAAPLAYLVDDEPMLLDLNEAVLRSMGFDVRRFRAAEIAFEAYRVAPVPPVIIITDYSMHKMTGLELIESCRKLRPGQKVLMVSGTVDASIFKDSIQKPDYFMPKPYSTERLAEIVRWLAGF